MQLRQHVGRGLIALDDRLRRIAFDDAGAAEILGDQEAGIEIGVADRGRRETARAQAIVDGDERLDVLGEMHGRAVGFSVIDRRAIRTRAANSSGSTCRRRGSAAHRSASRRRRACARAPHPESRHRSRNFRSVSSRVDLRRRLAIAGDFGGARGGSERRAMAEGDVDAIFGQRIGRALRPFDQRQRALRQRRQSDFLQLARIIDAVEIGVDESETANRSSAPA